KDAVARLTFVEDGGTYLCTGTLLNDTDNATQVPWFHTAHHCIRSAALAASLNTYWKYESTACGTNSLGEYVQLSGGADYLYSSDSGRGGTDGALLRLRDAAPAGAVFAGWDANALPSGISVLAIHHPAGDLKKVSAGQHLPARSDAASHAARWLEGTTEQGSSGSGLFTLEAGDYYLRGGLHGGDASCANSNTTLAGNVDWYSRFDRASPTTRPYPAPAPPQRLAAAASALKAIRTETPLRDPSLDAKRRGGASAAPTHCCAPMYASAEADAAVHPALLTTARSVPVRPAPADNPAACGR